VYPASLFQSDWRGQTLLVYTSTSLAALKLCVNVGKAFDAGARWEKVNWHQASGFNASRVNQNGMLGKSEG